MSEEPNFQHHPSDMATKEKMTIIAPLSIRLTESLKRDIDGLSELRGMEKSEYIRHLVEKDKEEQHRIWLERNQLFSKPNDGASTTACHSV